MKPTYWPMLGGPRITLDSNYLAFCTELQDATAHAPGGHWYCSPGRTSPRACGLSRWLTVGTLELPTAWPVPSYSYVSIYLKLTPQVMVLVKNEAYLLTDGETERERERKLVRNSSGRKPVSRASSHPAAPHA